MREKQTISQDKALMEEWDFEANAHLSPEKLTRGSGKKVGWKCSKCGNKWEANIYVRARAGHGCPYCAGQKVLAGYNDLFSKRPDIAQEWHPSKNGGLTPKDVMVGSHKKVWWLCPKGHEYEQIIQRRTSRGFRCPYCSGHKAWKGYNDFATRYPDVAKEWHPTKNGTLTPLDVTFGSGKRVWWLCPIGHEYQASIHDRGSGRTNCPICRSSQLTSFGEQAVFYYIKKVFPDAQSRYKDFWGNSMELDIYIPSIKVAIEYDGSHWHQTDAEYKREVRKFHACKQNGILLYRIKESPKQKWKDVADKVYSIKSVKRRNFKELEDTITSLLSEIKILITFEINIAHDINEIQGYRCEIKESLIKKRPDVVEKWNYGRNGELTPYMFSVSSNEIVWWKCPDCHHEWRSSINSMTRDGRIGCAICAKKHRGQTFTKCVVKKVGSLAETMPEVARQWHPTKNGDLTPDEITAGRFKPVWWLCDKCGHEWKASPNNRKKGVGCPCCSGRVPKIGVNDLETLFPEVVTVWDYEKNFPLMPKEFLPGSGKIVWWRCPRCSHSWQKIIRDKVKNPACPYCHSKILKTK